MKSGITDDKSVRLFITNPCSYSTIEFKYIHFSTKIYTFNTGWSQNIAYWSKFDFHSTENSNLA